MSGGSDRPRPFVMVTGHGRSGTTLLRESLNLHEEIYIAPETGFLPYVWGQRHLLDLLGGAERRRRIIRCLAKVEFPGDDRVIAARRGQVERALAEHPDYRRAFLAVTEALSDRLIVGEKTPWHLFFLGEVLAVRPGVRVLAIVRDPAAAVASMLGRKLLRRNDTLAQCAARWNLFARRLLRERRRLSGGQFLLVRFERLVRDPGVVLGEICAWIGVQPREAMLAPRMVNSSLRGHRTAQRGFDPQTLSRWRDRLAPEQIAMVRAMTGPLARAFGYPGGGNLPRRARLALWRDTMILRGAVAWMRSGFYPNGAFLGVRRRRPTPAAI